MRELLLSVLTFFLLFPIGAQSRAEAATPQSIVLELVGQIGGPTLAIAVEGDYAYVGVGQRLVVLDVSDPTMLQEIGATQPCEGFVEDVAIADNIAYLACGGAGLYLVDVSNPAYPTQVAIYNSPGYAEGIAVVGQHAFVADGWAGLRVIDISDPTQPTEVGSVYTLGYAFDVAVAGSYAYVAGGGAGLRVVDISDPADPAEVGFYNTPGYAHDIAVADDTAYVADEWEGLRVADVSDPTSPIEVGRYATPGQAFGVAVQGDTAYVADAFKGLRVIDISSPSTPQELGAYEDKGHARMVVVAGDRAYVADRNNGLRIIDVSNRASPTQVGLYSPLGHAEGVAVSGNYAYVAAGPYGLRIVNISNPAKPRQVGQYDCQGYATSVAIDGNYAYVTRSFPIGVDSSPPLQIVHVSNPSKPSRAASYNGRNPEYLDSVVSEDIAYIANGEGLVLIDVSNPNDPFEAGYISLAMQDISIMATGLDVSGPLAYVAVNELGIKIIDVSNPQNLTLIGTFTSESFFAEDVTVVGDRAYVAAGRGGLTVLDVSNPAQPLEMGSLETQRPVVHVAVDGSVAYVATGKSGVSAVDVSDPFSPRLITEYDTPGNAHAVVVKDNLLYVADGNAGLLVFEMVPSNASNNRASYRSNKVLENCPHVTTGHLSPKVCRTVGSEQGGQPSCGSVTHTPANAPPDTLVVTTTADSGEGSLRWCLENAQHGDTITFDDVIFPPDNPATISLASPLPGITQGDITIDASDAGVILDGQETSEDSFGITIDSDGNVIRGLQILFFGHGVDIARGSSNIIGGDRAKGEGPVGQGNVISGNGDGIFVGGNENVVVGNLVGTDVSGEKALGNKRCGIKGEGQNHRIGGTEPWERNIISGNLNLGVGLAGSGHSIIGNYIGTDVSGSYDLGNENDGVTVELGAFNQLVKGNLISGNGGGVTIWDWGSSYNTIVGNIIGLDASGTEAVANGLGVSVGGRAEFNRIGGTSPEDRNIISGNDGGIGLSSANNVVIGNFIGTDPSGTRPMGNGRGIECHAEYSFIGGLTVEERNVVSGNHGSGIELLSGCDYSWIAGNRIGTDASGTIALGNDVGVSIVGADQNAIQANLISDNREGGICIEDARQNVLFHNNLIDNKQNGFDGTGANLWDHGGEGNCWSDYTGEDADGDGIGDTPYQIPGDAGANDGYPLMESYPPNNPPNQPTNPSPANHATGVSVNADLSWTGGDPDAGDTVTYNVSFGTNSTPPVVSSNQTATSYDLSTLNYNSTYYWQIVATDNHEESTEGPVWNFTTAGEWDPWAYDEDNSKYIEIDELLQAINDYIGGEITIGQLLEIINLYISHTPKP